MYDSGTKIRDDKKLKNSWCELHRNGCCMDIYFTIRHWNDNRWQPSQYRFPGCYSDLWIPGSLFTINCKVMNWAKYLGQRLWDVLWTVRFGSWPALTPEHSHSSLPVQPLAATSYSSALQQAQLMHGSTQVVLTLSLWISCVGALEERVSMLLRKAKPKAGSTLAIIKTCRVSDLIMFAFVKMGGGGKWGWFTFHFYKNSNFQTQLFQH